MTSVKLCRHALQKHCPRSTHVAANIFSPAEFHLSQEKTYFNWDLYKTGILAMSHSLSVSIWSKFTSVEIFDFAESVLCCLDVRRCQDLGICSSCFIVLDQVRWWGLSLNAKYITFIFNWWQFHHKVSAIFHKLHELQDWQHHWLKDS